MITIGVIIGSTRKNRFADQPATWIVEQLKKFEDVKVEVLDLRDWPLPFYDESVSPAYNKGVYENELASKWAQKIGECDGFIIVTPEYNHGYPAVLKNALDYVYNQWNNKPVAFVSYGGVSGGTRSVQQLRQVVIELQMVPIRNGVHFVLYWDNLDENGKLKTAPLEQNAKNMLEQLLSFAKALKPLRKEA